MWLPDGFRVAAAGVRGAVKGAVAGAGLLVAKERRRLASPPGAADTSTDSPAADKQRRRTSGTKGFASPSRFSAIQIDDYNADLRGRQWFRVADKMRRSDGQVRAILSVVGLPIRATRWHLEPPKNPSGTEKEAVELLDANLFGGMAGSFDDLLREMVRAAYCGVAVPEIEWAEVEGRNDIHEVHSRNLELIESWLYDAGARLVGYLFVGNRIVGSGLTDAQPTVRQERVPVPLDRCIHAKFEAENGSPVGMALGRAMYTHWYHKQALYKLGGIGLERNWLGVPVAKAEPTASWDDKDEMLEILAKLRATDDGGIVLPAGWDLEWFEASRSLADVMPLLNHHDALMARSVLAQFLNLGQTQTGTQSLAEEHVGIFLQGEDALARWIGEVLTKQLVERWCRVNYGEGLRCPRLRHRPIRAHSLEAMARALKLLEEGAFITPTEADEAHIRAVAELPEQPENQRRAARQQNRPRDAEPEKSEHAGRQTAA